MIPPRGGNPRRGPAWRAAWAPRGSRRRPGARTRRHPSLRRTPGSPPPGKESLSHLHFLDLLLGTQADARRERAVARRIREARFADSKTLEGFDWQFNPKAFDRVQIEELATGDFIRRCNNLIMVGWSGIGKSHIIQALGQRVCVQGYRVVYRTSAELLADLTASLADKTLPARLRYC